MKNNQNTVMISRRKKGETIRLRTRDGDIIIGVKSSYAKLYISAPRSVRIEYDRRSEAERPSLPAGAETEFREILAPALA